MIVGIVLINAMAEAKRACVDERYVIGCVWIDKEPQTGCMAFSYRVNSNLVCQGLDQRFYYSAVYVDFQ